MQNNKNILALLILLGLIALAFIYRLNPVLRASYDGLMSDDAMYMSMARSFYEGNLNAIIHPFWMPLYPLVSAFFFRFVQNWTFASELTSAVSGIMLLVPIYFVGKYYVGRIVGLLSAFLLIFLFPLVYASHESYAESLEVFLFWMGTLFYLKALDTKKIIFAFLSGIFWGLTFLTRTEGLFVIVGLLAFNLLLTGLTIKKKFKISNVYLKIILFVLFFGYLMTKYPYLGVPGFIGVIIFLLFFFFFLLLKNNYQIKVNLLNLSKVTLFTLIGFFIFYFLYNGALVAKYKKPLFLAKASTFLNPAGYSSLNKSGTSTWGQDLVFPETFNPNSEFIIKNFYETQLFKNQNIITGALENTFFLIGRLFYFTSKESLILFFIGIYWLIFKFRDYSKKMFLFLMLAPMIFFISIISIDTSERYLYFASPIIPLGIAFAVNYLSSFFKSLKVKILSLVILIFFASYSISSHSALRGESISFNINLPEYISLFTGEKARAYKEDTEIMSLLKDKRVMGRHENLGFNYRSSFIYSPTIKTFDEFISYARLWHVNYIAAGPNDINRSVSFLYEEPKDYPGLKLTSFLLDPDTYIYEVIY